MDLRLRSCIAASHSFFFSTHRRQALFFALPTGFTTNSQKLLYWAISGKEWELGTQLSQEAEKNLQAALSYFEEEFLPTIQGVTYQ